MKTTNTTASTVEATETKQAHAHALEFITSKGLLSEYVNRVINNGHTDPEAEELATELDDDNYLEDKLGDYDDTSTKPTTDDNNANTSTERGFERCNAAITTISQETRDYLALCGKLSDAFLVFCQIVERDCEEPVEYENKFSELLTNAEDIVHDLLRDKIRENIGFIGATEI